MRSRPVLTAAVLTFLTLGLAAQQQKQEPAPVDPGSGVSSPGLVRRVEPQYTAEARQAKIQGEVWIEAVVGTDGSVRDVRVRRSLDTQFGLDAEAMRAARMWTFTPGRRGTEAVPVNVTLILEFRLDPGQSPAEDAKFREGTVPDDTPGLVKAKVLKTTEPRYTSDALRARIHGDVQIDAVVLPNGTVGRARIVKSLDNKFGLDAEALRAAHLYLFSPATLDGRPVATVVPLTLEFRIH